MKQAVNTAAMPGMINQFAKTNQAPPRCAIERACSMKEELLTQIERLGERLPPNTLDQLIDELGGPENVAEMTGRKGRVVQTEDGSIQYESRSEADVPLETLNLTEKQRSAKIQNQQINISISFKITKIISFFKNLSNLFFIKI